MSPFKRTQRASAKQRARGAHAKPAAPRGVADVPVELQTRDYQFPRVQLPQERPHPSPTELRESLDDERTQQLPPVALAGVVLDGTPKPAQHDGLAPAAAPSIPDPQVAAQVREAADLMHREHAAARHADAQTRVAALEAAVLGRPAPRHAALPVSRARHVPPAPGARGFDSRFWSELGAVQHRVHAVADTLAVNNDQAAAALDERLWRLEFAQRDETAQTNAPRLPRRKPGAARAAIEAGELVSQ